jgi:hypothetical protein
MEVALRKVALARVLGAALLAVTLGGCRYTCQELQDKYADKLTQIRRQCDCGFKIECDPNYHDGGTAGITIRDPSGLVLVRLPGGDQKVEKKTLRHELVHALDMCAHLSENALPTPPAVVGTRAEYIFDIRRALLAEFVAYRTTGPLEDVKVDASRFPNPDSDDLAILSSYASVGSTLTSTLPLDVFRDLDKTLDAADLGPQQIRQDSSTYQALKRTLITEATRIQTALGPCLKLVLDLGK